MGYRRKVKTYDLTWAEGHDLHGLEVVTKGLSIERLLGLARMAAEVTGRQRALAAGQLSQKEMEDLLEKLSTLCQTFAVRLISWNLEDDDGNPVPATYAAINDMDDKEFMLDLILSWMEAIASVDTPLPKPSNGSAAAPNPELSLPMAPLPASPTN